LTADTYASLSAGFTLPDTRNNLLLCQPGLMVEIRADNRLKGSNLNLFIMHNIVTTA